MVKDMHACIHVHVAYSVQLAIAKGVYIATSLKQWCDG